MTDRDISNRDAATERIVPRRARGGQRGGGQRDSIALHNCNERSPELEVSGVRYDAGVLRAESLNGV